MTDSNVDLAIVNNFANTGIIPQNIEPAIPKAIVLVAKGTTIPASAFDSQAAFLAYAQTASAQGFIANTRNPRWLILQNCDTFKDETKAMATKDTGLNQFGTIKFNPKWSFRYLTNKANHQEAMSLDNAQNQYDVFTWDAATNIWGQTDVAGTGGMTAFTLQQIRIMDWIPYTVEDMNQYYFTIQLKNRSETNENFAIYNTGMDSDSIKTLLNARMQDVSAILGTPLTITTTTDIVCIMKAGQNSIDLASPQFYQSALTAGCFTAKNLTLGTTLTISTLQKGSIVVAGQAYNYLWFTLSAAPTATNLVQISLGLVSVVNAIIPNFNAVTEVVQLGVDGSNCAVHTF